MEKMKRIQTFAVASLMALAVSFTLASCSSDDINTEDGGSPSATTTAQTVFSCGDDDQTRTSINNKRAFFWEKGDKIWIYDGSQWQKSTKSDIAAPQTPQAKFVLSGNYTDNEYQLLYTGYANGDTATTQYNKVTIADVQTQKTWNDGSHLGTSGDCGTARAYRQANNTYRFSLEHKASYLLFYPFLHTDLTGDYTLEKIEVYSDLSATNIAGTFDFTFANGLANSPAAGTGKQEMTLNCGNLATGEFGLPKTAPNLSDANNAAPHCFMVIAPGDHQLTIRYVTKKSDGTQQEFIKDVALKQYKPNGVYTFVHEMKDAEVDFGFEFNEVNTFYRWGRTYEAYGTTDDRDYDPSSTEVTTGFWSTIPTTDIARKYLGDTDNCYYDNSTKWKYNRRDGTVETRRGGWWLKKIDYCTGELAYMKNCVLGRPSIGEIEHYFFLPDLPWTGKVKDEVIWWLSSPDSSVYPFPETSSTAARLNFSSTHIAWIIGRKSMPYIAGLRPDGTPWFQ